MNKTSRLTESAVMLALATVLSILPIADLPYGGSITLCSMLPIVVISYRYGIKHGIFTGSIYGLIQMLLGIKNVMFFTTPISIIAVILLDYIFAFAVIGMSGIFHKAISSQTSSMVYGTLLTCLMRYILHVIAGATVWAGLSIPDSAAVIYSFAYNATYMIPETIVLTLGVYLVGNMLELKGNKVERKATSDEDKGFSFISGIIAVGTLIFDVCLIFSHLQDAETGEFIIKGLATVDWKFVIIITAIGFVLSAVLRMIKKVRT